MLEEQVAGLDEAVGPVTALAFVMTIGEVSRFPRGKKVASYLSGADSGGTQLGQQTAAGRYFQTGHRVLARCWSRRAVRGAA